MTPFQMHSGRKPRIALTDLIGKPECLLSNWKRTLTNFISAQPTELQVVTIKYSDGEMADYLVLNETRKRGRTVSRDFKMYHFYEKESKPDSMKCSFKTNKILTAVKETDHTITTSEGRIIHKNLASKPSKFQTSRKTDEQKKATNRCHRCGKFSNGELCETHLRLQTTGQDPNNNIEDNEPNTSHTLPTMPMKKKKQGYNLVVVYDSSSRDSDSVNNDADKDSSGEEVNPEETGLRAEIGREIKNLRRKHRCPQLRSDVAPKEPPTQHSQTNTWSEHSHQYHSGT